LGLKVMRCCNSVRDRFNYDSSKSFKMGIKTRHFYTSFCLLPRHFIPVLCMDNQAAPANDIKALWLLSALKSAIERPSLISFLSTSGYRISYAG
jgi:hypothetical protein